MLKPDRRTVLKSIAALGAVAHLGPGPASAAAGPVLTRAVPSTDEKLPVIGMGSWITFNVGENEKLRAGRVKVLQKFFDRGGGMIDSSPMYGSSEEVIGHCLKKVSNSDSLFAATKVWTVSKWLGIRQMKASEELWGQERFDLMQIHNLVDWETHRDTLLKWKDEGRIRYMGITTSHGRRHGDFLEIMASEPFDFVQFTYNVLDREAEKRLLPLAADKGLGVIINRPFRRGGLFDHVARHPLPGWAAEIDCANWAQVFLKFVVSHPAVTCAIPATSQVAHMDENMSAAQGRMPDQKMRERMIAHIENL